VIALYGICTGSSRLFAYVPAISCIENQDATNRQGKSLMFQRGLWWARQGLNLRPHPCEGNRREPLTSGYLAAIWLLLGRPVRALYERSVCVRGVFA
jgi:hypothetical protein